MGEGRAIRTFLGLELGDAARRRAAGLVRDLRGREGGERVRWVREESLHVTLRFLGSIDPAAIPGLVRCVGGEIGGVRRFSLGLLQARAFPSARRPRVVALELGPLAPLEALAQAVERGVVSAGFPPEERPFRPHVTLGRVRRGQPPLPDVTVPVTEPDDAWEVSEAVLFQSETSRAGARYTPLERIPVGVEVAGLPRTEDTPETRSGSHELPVEKGTT